MLKQIADWFKGQFTLSQEVVRLHQEQNDLRSKLEQQTDLLREVLLTLEHDRTTQRQAHENLLLKLEVELLKFDRRLPPKRTDDQPPQLSE